MRVKNALVILSVVSVVTAAAFHPAPAGAATKTQGDFNLSNRFSFEIDGVSAPGIRSFDGPQLESEVVEYKDGEDGVTHTRPGNHKPGKMTVSKDWSNTSEWYAWRQNVINGKVERKSISVIFHNDAGEEVGRFNFHECWPVKWEFAANNARSSGHASEKLEIVFETYDYKK